MSGNSGIFSLNHAIFRLTEMKMIDWGKYMFTPNRIVLVLFITEALYQAKDG